MRRLVSLAFALATLSSPLAAQSAPSTHPDFSGKWTLDTKSLDPALAAALTSMTVTVAQDAKTMKVDNATTSPTMGEQKTTMSFNLDGSPSKNTLNAQGAAVDLTSKTAWEGQTLAVTTSGDMGGQALQFVERWSLDDGGKTLHVQRDVSAAGQSMTIKLAFNKQ